MEKVYRNERRRSKTKATSEDAAATPKGSSDLDVAREAPRPRWADDHPPIRATTAAAGWAASEEDAAQGEGDQDGLAREEAGTGAASCPPAGPVLGSVHAQDTWFPLEGRRRCQPRNTLSKNRALFQIPYPRSCFSKTNERNF